MPRRISDVLGEKVAAAIQALPVLQVTRDEIGWEITPVLLPTDGSGAMNLAYMIAVSLPVVAGLLSSDHVLYMTALGDPHADQGTVNLLVYRLYERCQAEADERLAEIRAQSNGRGESPGGLILP